MSRLFSCALGAAFLITTPSSSVHAGPITPGDLVVYRVGDGTAALGTTATAVFLDEYTTGGTLVQSIPLASTGASALTAVGNASTEGILTRSQDGQSLIFTGYRKDAGGTNPASDAPATTNRLIGTIDAAGTPTIGITLTNPTGTIRSAATANGTAYYVGTSALVGYVGTPGVGATVTQIDPRNSRQVLLADNNLYASNGSTAVTAKVQSYGNQPTGATTPTPIVTLATADAVNGFVFFDLDPTVPGADTLYLLSTVQSQLQKYVTTNGTNWTAAGSVSTTAQNVTGFANGTNVSLYFTTPGALQTLTDASGIGGTLTGTPASIATAAVNTAFRGVNSVPEPTSLGLCAGAALLALGRQRRSVRAN
jgi:hypothetical protein